ncbi:UV DNA damage repair endonuclease UvsE [Paenibacillus sp. N1-5-1-14]|uniref:UV DNA damage repair endonuclease UvsE n=1 Tax=Paenibacillus radicibacter TaxID=2972488 RepID=UPI002159AA96|nr:UV DNA damage repair endonuclease UvsE [Paenibacillus radicibacter]MCR8643047.1 UV DNA damage repair endonuclease UvsE [Paenibacillus radicibacter]
MIVRFGYVAMSTIVEKASPSRTMTVTSFNKLQDREAGLRKLERLAAENLHNSLRLLKHNRAHDIVVFRFSSKLIPLIGHESVEGWNPMPVLADDFKAVGDYVKQHQMRVSFHPDHFTVLSTPRESVLQSSIGDIERHTAMLEAMGLNTDAKSNIHIGGAYGDKVTASKRFVEHFALLRPEVRARLTLENDDKTFTALETLEVCEQVGVPMVLDIHHDEVNLSEQTSVELWPRILKTWEQDAPLPPKIHVSSPKNETNPRSHADYVDPVGLLAFMRGIAPFTPHLDVMIEAKMKDSALIQLVQDLINETDVEQIDEASISIKT